MKQQTVHTKRRLGMACVEAALGTAICFTVWNADIAGDLLNPADPRCDQAAAEQLDNLVRSNAELKRVQRVVRRYAPKNGCAPGFPPTAAQC